MTWTILDYARKDCRVCDGGGLEMVPDYFEVHGRVVDVGYPEICMCVIDKIKNVHFRYFELGLSSSDDTEDEVPF